MAEKREDNTGKMEVAVRILGNELVALKMVVDDFKIKWLIYGVVTVSYTHLTLPTIYSV